MRIMTVHTSEAFNSVIRFLNSATPLYGSNHFPSTALKR